MNEKIDFVILWVDENDPKWQQEKAKYSVDRNQDGGSQRYRDWNNLHYWFRAVEKYAPWVNKIHFVTCGQVPEWMNTAHPKLQLVDHKDIIPAEYLPTFSSRAIDLNLHNIPGLAEHFVYFNDDMFLTDKVNPEDFFVNGLPRDMFVEYPLGFSGKTYVYSHTMVNNFHTMGKYFTRKQLHKDLKNKILTSKYGLIYFIYNLLMFYIPFPNFIGVLSPHLPLALLKKTYEELWELEPQILESTISHRFRTMTDVNNFIFRHWRLLNGDFYPTNMFKKGHYYAVSKEMDRICKDIEKQRYKMICINDDCTQEEYTQMKERIIDSFQKILPEKSSFEI